MAKEAQQNDLDIKIQEGLKTMDGAGGLGELPKILKVILKDVQTGKMQPMLQTIDGRQVPPIVGLRDFLKIIVNHPRLAQEFGLVYFNTDPHIGFSAQLGTPLLSQQDYQFGVVDQKVERMSKLLKDIGLGDAWKMLKPEELKIALATLFDQLLFLYSQELQSSNYVDGFVGKYGSRDQIKQVIDS